MKNYILLAGLILCSAFAKAQTTSPQPSAKTANNLPAEGHLLDQQAQVLGNIFGDLGGMEEMQGINGYMDLLNKSDLDPELKVKFKEQYKLLVLAEDPLKKREQQIALTKMLKEALEESQGPNKPN